MSIVGAYEAKTHLPRLLDEVGAGEVVTITKHGVPIARLVSVDAPTRDVPEVIDELRRQRTGTRLDGLSIRAMVEEGRK